MLIDEVNEAGFDGAYVAWMLPMSMDVCGS